MTGDRGAIGGLARMGLGAIAGAAATFVMDSVTEVFATAYIKRREAAVSSQSAAAALASKMLTALGLRPEEDDVAKASPGLHWTIGIGSGIVAGLLAGEGTRSIAVASATATSGMLGFDEFGLSAIGAMPSSLRYPWQTHLRSVAGHITYGFVLALGYSTLAALVRQTGHERDP